MKAYQKTVDHVIAVFDTNISSGLSTTHVLRQFKQYGYNKLPEAAHESLLIIFLRQFQSPLIYILLCAAAIIFLLGHYLDACFISGVLFFNAIIGTIQEGRTHTILDSLQTYLTTDALVVRNNQKRVIPDQEVVPGDIVILQEGEKVPADCRIIESFNLYVDESMLTGESTRIRKYIHTLAETLPVHDQNNMVFKGTYVLSGHARAIVTATGSATEIGKLNIAIQEIETETPLKKSIDRLSHGILFIVFVMCIMLFMYGLIIGKPFNELLVILTALFICVIPEGLPVVFTLTLVTSAYRLAKHNILVKRLQAVEGLGRVNLIIIDKTGTLTKNEMMVTQIYADHQFFNVSGQGYVPEGDIIDQHSNRIDPKSINSLQQIAYGVQLMNHTQIEFEPQHNRPIIKGDPTEAALSIYAQKCGISDQDARKRFTIIYQMPFDPIERIQMCMVKEDTTYTLFASGAPEAIFKRTQPDSIPPSVLSQMFTDGLRIISVAQKQLSVEHIASITEQNFTLRAENMILLGLVGIRDTIRPEAAESIYAIKNAGVSVIMATGDHAQTAQFIAQQVGIPAQSHQIIDGHQLTIDPQRNLDDISIFARVTPQQKIDIVTYYKNHGNIVAMTGDGVNDAPSLIAADLGIAMGGIGTEVAKQAADIILLDDSFKNITRALSEGRHIYQALRRVILYFFTTNLAEVLIILFSLVLNLPLPLLAAQILWLNLITDGFLDVALSMEPHEPQLLRTNVNWPTAYLIDGSMLAKMVYMAIPMGLGSLAIFYHYYQTDIAYARTMTLVTMAVFQWFNAWNCRSETRTVLQCGLFSNRWLIGATIMVVLLQIFIVQVPAMQLIFKTVPLRFNDWIIIIGITSPIFIIEEVRKLIFNRT